MLLKGISDADVEAFLQAMNKIADCEKNVDKISDRLDLFIERERSLQKEVDEINATLEAYERGYDSESQQEKKFHRRISEKEEVQRLQENLGTKNQYLDDLQKEIQVMEKEIEELEHKEKNNALNNAQMIVEFLIAPNQRNIDVNVDTHKLNHVKATIAEALYKYKMEFPDKKYIRDEDHDKQKFIRMLENIVLKPDGSIIHERLKELYEVYDLWAIDQSNNMYELIEWLYSYNVFNKSEKKRAIEGIRNQTKINFNRFLKN